MLRFGDRRGEAEKFRVSGRIVQLIVGPFFGSSEVVLSSLFLSAKECTEGERERSGYDENVNDDDE